MHSSPPADLLPRALIQWIRLIKAVRFYPPEHPALKVAGEATLAALRPLLQNDNLALTVRKDGILYHDAVVGPNHGGIRSLAHYLFARRIQQLLLLPDLTILDLIVFSRNLIRSPAEIRDQGGLQELLIAEQAAGIWVNELDLSIIRAARERIRDRAEEVSVGTEEQPAENAGNDRQMTFREGVATEATGDAALDDHLLDRLSLGQLLIQLPREPSEPRFQRLLSRLPGQVRRHLDAPHLPQVLQAFQVLATLHRNRRLANTRRREVLRCLHQLAEPQLLDFLIDNLCQRGMPRPLRDRTMQTLVFLRDKALPQLIGRLAGEQDVLARKQLSATLIRLGPVAIPGLLPMLQDERCHLVRNVIAILGQIGAAHLVGHLQPLLWHQDVSIARETIRALARLDGEPAVEALLQLVDKCPRELYPQAITALGIMRHPAAVPNLVKIISARDLFMKQTELKTAAIKALGRIGSPEAIPALERLARFRLPWGRARRTALRIQAIAALAQIGSPASRPVLETLARRGNRQVAQAALRTLQQWPDSQKGDPAKGEGAS